MLGPFLLHLQAFINNGIFPKEFDDQLEREVPRFKIWKDAIYKHPKATAVWDEKVVIAKVNRHLADLQAGKKE